MSYVQKVRGLSRYRARVFNVYWTFFVTIVVGWVFLATANFIRYDGFPWLYELITQFIPAVIVAYAMDPLLIVAFIIGALFFWSFPWSDFFSSGGSQNAPDDFRRGRRISGPQAADYMAYQQLMRQRNRRRKRRRIRNVESK